MLYFYLKKGPAYRRIYQDTLILPHQTHLGAENALFLPKKSARLPKNLSKYPARVEQAVLLPSGGVEPPILPQRARQLG